jgi:hypothetical protein
LKAALNIATPLKKNQKQKAHNSYLYIKTVAVYGAAGVGFAFMAKNLGGTVLQVDFIDKIIHIKFIYFYK